eukprot:GHVU01094964.1.p1 GENE.GHVU01094964.1~~GHVU01094964.1.p1  ORF type:complete len:174 (+),score=26.42 GHVU01094964.1:60-581(+)
MGDARRRLEEAEQCHDAACRDTPSGVGQGAAAVARPPSRDEVGRAAWKVLHTAASRYFPSPAATATADPREGVSRIHDGEEERGATANGGGGEAVAPERCQEQRRAWLRAFVNLYPCHVCREGFLDVIAALPPDTTTRRALTVWTCEAHNAVNKEIGLPTYPCRYEDLIKMFP